MRVCHVAELVWSKTCYESGVHFRGVLHVGVKRDGIRIDIENEISKEGSKQAPRDEISEGDDKGVTE